VVFAQEIIKIKIAKDNNKCHTIKTNNLHVSYQEGWLVVTEKKIA